jgi:hypothetical protein
VTASFLAALLSMFSGYVHLDSGHALPAVMLKPQSGHALPAEVRHTESGHALPAISRPEVGHALPG